MTEGSLNKAGDSHLTAKIAVFAIQLALFFTEGRWRGKSRGVGTLISPNRGSQRPKRAER